MRNGSDSPSAHLTLQMLAWLDEAPRTYGETMNAWRTSCPRLSIWEDAVGDGLVRITPQDGAKTRDAMRDARVVVTPKGKARLKSAANIDRTTGRMPRVAIHSLPSS